MDALLLGILVIIGGLLLLPAIFEVMVFSLTIPVLIVELIAEKLERGR